MSNSRISRAGTFVVKSGVSSVRSKHLVAMTDFLIKHGVPTPPAIQYGKSGEVWFPFLAGVGGLERLVEEGPDTLSNLLGPVVQLHKIPIPDRLEAFDPFARIVERVRGPDDAAIDSLAEKYRRSLPAPKVTGIIHGDFHAGQLLTDNSHQVWLLDLEDLAVGPGEADIGNFAAHLATRPETRKQRRLDSSIGYWFKRTCNAYSRRHGHLFRRPQGPTRILPFFAER